MRQPDFNYYTNLKQIDPVRAEEYKNSFIRTNGSDATPEEKLEAEAQAQVADLHDEQHPVVEVDITEQEVVPMSNETAPKTLEEATIKNTTAEPVPVWPEKTVAVLIRPIKDVKAALKAHGVKNASFLTEEKARAMADSMWV